MTEADGGTDASSLTGAARAPANGEIDALLAEGAVFGVFGTGGHGREVAWIARDRGIAADRLRFVVDPGYATAPAVDGIAVLTTAEFTARHSGAPIFVAVGDVRARRSVAERLAGEGHVFPVLVARQAVLSDRVTCAPGVVVFPGAVATVNVDLGRHVHLDTRSSVSHDVSIGEFTSLSPGVVICGHVAIGPDVFVGAAACVVNGTPEERLVVGAGAFVKAGALVVRSVPEGSRVG